jgi:LmbE family N-acetylglucosaminyl deacetylase
MLDDMSETSENTTLLGVWAHPDDETYLSAAFMHRVRTAGGRVVVATATLGDAGIDSLPPDRAASVRHRELRAALAAVDVFDLRIFGYRDGHCQDVEHEEGVARVEALIREVEPDVIVTFGPDGVTGHPDHLAVSRWTMEAWQRVGHGELLLATMTDAFLVEHESLHGRLGLSMLQSVPERDLAMRVTPTRSERSRKRDALDAHVSQTAPFIELLGYSAFHDWWVDECFRVPTTADLQWAAPVETAVWTR